MRKKIPLIGGIINLIESLKGDIGIIENTDVATHSISAGSYVIWKNELYKASSAIAVDDALSSSNLTAVSGGAANELNGEDVTVTPASGFTLVYNASKKIGKNIFLCFEIKKTSGNITSDTWTTVASVSGYSITGAIILPAVSLGGNVIARAEVETDGTIKLVVLGTANGGSVVGILPSAT